MQFVTLIVSIILLFTFNIVIFPRVLNGQTIEELTTLSKLITAAVNDESDLTTLNTLAETSNFLFNPTKLYQLRSSYDYIIVGSGPAGCVLANRLSEDNKVLLIEAGLPESYVQKVPLAATLSINSKYIRTYDIEKTANTSLNLINEQCPYPVGEALGGSSTVNYMIYTRGNKDDYDRWYDNGANPGWSYTDSWALYDELESSTAFEKSANPSGSLNIENAPYQTGLLNKYLAAGLEMNQSVVDYNNLNQMGIAVTQGTSKRGHRVSAAEAYINNVFKWRLNLHILTNAMVSKILIDSSTKTAYGVTFLLDGESQNVTASKEVIVSAGPIRSAQLLMVSGIGPKDHLLEKDIPVIQDLPIGEYFDHVLVVTPTFITNTSGESLNLNRVKLSDFLKFPLGQGLTTMYLGLEAVAFHKTSNSTRPEYCPDLELLFMSGGLHSDMGLGFSRLARIKQEVYADYFGPLESTAIDTWSSGILLLHPRTSGRVSLRDNSMLTDPVIEYPFFKEEQDLKDIVEAIRIAIQYAKTEAMQSVGSTLYHRKLVGCEEYDLDTGNYWECYIRHMATTLIHTTGTNRMGPSDDPRAVVDSNCRVHGIKGLRVADTSVVPVSMSGHTQAVSYLVGERVAKFIKAGN